MSNDVIYPYVVVFNMGAQMYAFYTDQENIDARIKELKDSGIVGDGVDEKNLMNLSFSADVAEGVLLPVLKIQGMTYTAVNMNTAKVDDFKVVKWADTPTHIKRVASYANGI